MRFLHMYYIAFVCIITQLFAGWMWHGSRMPGVCGECGKCCGEWMKRLAGCFSKMPAVAEAAPENRIRSFCPQVYFCLLW